ncbi:MAG: thrombospondin type 3 repeat-containing protein [Kofleriaceae bacterium]
MLAACAFEGALGLGGGSKGPDHDGDGVVDDVDVCPHISNAGQSDADGDGVGDECDPINGVPHRRVLFDGFSNGPNAELWDGVDSFNDWEKTGNSTNGYWQQKAFVNMSRQILFKEALLDATVQTRLVIDEIGPNMEAQYHEAALVVDEKEGSNPRSFALCGIRSPHGGTPSVVGSFVRGGGSAAENTAVWAANFSGTSLFITAHVSAAGALACEVKTNGAMGAPGVPQVAGNVAGGRVGLSTFGAIARYDFIFIVEPLP